MEWYEYDAFGELHSSTGSTANDYLLTGQQYDAATGLYFLRARYYDPAIGRFLSQDPYPVNTGNPMELNRYVYTANNPVNYADPSGLLADQYAVQTNESSKIAQYLALVGLFVVAVILVIICYLMGPCAEGVKEVGETVGDPFSDFINGPMHWPDDDNGGGWPGPGGGGWFPWELVIPAIAIGMHIAIQNAGKVLPRVVPYVLPHEKNKPERKKPEKQEECDPTVDPDCEDDEDVWVVRGGVADASNLMKGVDEHSGVPGLTGFSVQSERGKTVEELAAAARFRNNQISVTTVQRLAAIGVAVVPSPGRGFHKTAVTPNPLPEVQAQLISTVFTKRPNPARWEG